MNINIKELRLGNIVEYDGFQYEVQGIGFNKIDIGLEEWVDIDYVFGVSLNEDILEKLKFTYRRVVIGAGLYRTECYFMNNINTDFIIYLVKGGITLNSYPDRNEVIYYNIHELQNLYNILTKEELIYET